MDDFSKIIEKIRRKSPSYTSGEIYALWTDLKNYKSCGPNCKFLKGLGAWSVIMDK